MTNLEVWNKKINEYLAKFDSFSPSESYLFEAQVLIIQLKDESKASIEALLLDLQEIVCTNIDEPAGQGCGYGITEAGQLEIKKLVENFLKPKR